MSDHIDYVVRAKEVDGSEWVNAEAFDAVLTALKGLESWITNSSTDTREGRMSGRKALIVAREVIAKVKAATRDEPREIPYNPAWTHGEIGADEAAMMEANGWRMRPDGSYFKPGS